MSKYKVYLSEDGSVARTEQEGAIFSRSNLVNTLVVYSPLPSDYLIRAGFTRADGVTPHSQFLYYVGQQDGYSCYEYHLTSYQLGAPGALGISLDIFKANDDAVLTTATFTVQVGTSFAPVVDEEPVDDSYTFQIVEAMEQFQQAVSIANKTVDARPTANSKNLVESGGVKSAIDDVRFEFQEEHNRIYSSIATLYDSKQDNLIAGDGIKIEGNVISAIGGGSAQYKVTYDYEELSFYFYTNKQLTDVYELMEYFYENGNNYDNPLPVEGCFVDAGLYEEAGDIILYVYDYEESWGLNFDGFNFSGGSSGGEEDNVPYFAAYDGFSFYFDAPAGLHDASDVYAWLQRNGHTYSDNLYEVRDCYYEYENYSEAGIYADGGMVILHENAEHTDLCQIEYFDRFQENP